MALSALNVEAHYTIPSFCCTTVRLDATTTAACLVLRVNFARLYRVYRALYNGLIRSMHLYSTYFGLEGVPKTVLDKEYACLYYLSTWALGVSKSGTPLPKNIR